MAHTLPDLHYEYDSLEPHIDSQTMEIHHDKHHAGYVKKLNAALEGTGFEDKDVKELLSDLSALPEDKKQSIINNGGGHYNHSLFWPLLKKNISFNPESELGKEIIEAFGSLEKFKEKFAQTATTRFGSGWAWLILTSEGKLEIMSTKNQDNPISQGKEPILGLDVWEHAYYLKYQNKRGDYIDSFWNVLNWEKANENFLNAKKG